MTSIRSIQLPLCFAVLLTGASTLAGGDTVQPPIDPGLREGVESRLVQFEVRVFRKGVLVGGLSAADFDIAGSLVAGKLTYFVRVVSGDVEIASREFPFEVADVPNPSPEIIAPPAR